MSQWRRRQRIARSMARPATVATQSAAPPPRGQLRGVRAAAGARPKIRQRAFKHTPRHGFMQRSLDKTSLLDTQLAQLRQPMAERLRFHDQAPQHVIATEPKPRSKDQRRHGNCTGCDSKRLHWNMDIPNSIRGGVPRQRSVRSTGRRLIADLHMQIKTKSFASAAALAMIRRAARGTSPGRQQEK